MEALIQQEQQVLAVQVERGGAWELQESLISAGGAGGRTASPMRFCLLERYKRKNHAKYYFSKQSSLHQF